MSDLIDMLKSLEDSNNKTKVYSFNGISVNDMDKDELIALTKYLMDENTRHGMYVTTPKWDKYESILDEHIDKQKSQYRSMRSLLTKKLNEFKTQLNTDKEVL